MRTLHAMKLERGSGWARAAALLLVASALGLGCDPPTEYGGQGFAEREAVALGEHAGDGFQSEMLRRLAAVEERLASARDRMEQVPIDRRSEALTALDALEQRRASLEKQARDLDGSSALGADQTRYQIVSGVELLETDVDRFVEPLEPAKL